MREEVEVLEHHPDLGSHLVDVLQVAGQLDPVDDDLARLMFLKPVDTADQRGLARARRPGDDDAFAPVHGQVDVAQDVEGPVPLVHLDDLDRDFLADLHLAAIDFAGYGVGVSHDGTP